MTNKERRLRLKCTKILKILTKYGDALDKYDIPYHVTFANKAYVKQNHLTLKGEFNIGK